MKNWINVKDLLPAVSLLEPYRIESDSVLIECDDGSRAVAYYTSELDGAEGGWVLPVQKFTGIGYAADLIIGVNFIRWQALS